MPSDSTTSTRGTGTAPGAGERSRSTTVVLWVLQVVVALGFLFSAVAKFTAMPMVMATFQALGAPWLAYVIGALEVLGAVAMFVPRLCGLAATAFVALTVGALITHLVVGGDPTLALALLVLSAIVAIVRRRETAALIRSVTG